MRSLWSFSIILASWMSLQAQAETLSLPAASPCLSRSMYSNSTSYTITNTAGEIVGTVTATSSSDLAAAFQHAICSG